MAFPVAVNTYSYIYREDAFACMRRLKRLGFTDFELLFNPGHIWPSEVSAGERRAMPGRLSDEGLDVLSFNLPIMDHNITSPVPEMRRFTIERFRDMIDLAHDLGVRWIVLVPGKVSPLFPAPGRDLMNWFRDGIAILVEHARGADVTLLVENVPMTFIPTADHLMTALEAADPDGRVGVVYDVANAVFAGEDPAVGLRRVESRLRLVHLSDTGTAVWRHDPVGRGVVDFASVAETLRAIGYRGPSVLEIISAEPDTDLADSRRRLAPMGWDAGSAS